jgi:hypothetical protein
LAIAACPLNREKDVAQFQQFAKDVEVNGQTVLAVVMGMHPFENKALKILAENGIDNPAPDKWYSQQSWLNAFQNIAGEIGSYALYCIGTKIPETAQFPADIDSLTKALAAVDIAYHMNHRGGDIGHYHFHQPLDGPMSFTCTNPYPCEFDRGIIEGIARRFAPDGHHITIKHDEGGPCRDRGEGSCTYHIEISTI